MYEALRNDHRASGAIEALDLMERLLNAEHRRFIALPAEHRLSCMTGERSVNVMAGVAQNVAVLAERGS